MKMTFLVPPILVGSRAIERVAGCTYTLYPVPNIYELTVAALLEREGFQVAYKEGVMEGWREADFLDFLRRDDSQLYSIWTVNLGKENDLQTHRLIRSIKKDVPVVFLGPGSTYFVKEFIPDEHTYVVRGEPEETALELATFLSNGDEVSNILGLSYMGNGTVVDTPPRPVVADLDALPFPARHLIDRDRYFNPKLAKRPYTPVKTMRNCPYQCTYCVPSSLSFAREIEHKRTGGKGKPPIKMRSVENVAEELHLLEREGYKAISFLDDTFTLVEQRTLELCEVLKDTDLVWGCQARADNITPEVARAMADSGCQYVDLGVESFDQAILDYVKKDLRAEDNVRGITLLKEHGITAKINVLIGSSPLETKDTIKQTHRMIRELGVDQVMFSITSPFPGTEFYKMAKNKGWFVDGDYVAKDVQKKAIVSYPGLSAKQMERTLFWANLRFFLSPRFIRNNLTRFKRPKDFWVSAKALYRKLFAQA